MPDWVRLNADKASVERISAPEPHMGGVCFPNFITEDIMLL